MLEQQRVFGDLADVYLAAGKKVGSSEFAFRAKTVLSGWLYHKARLTAANLQRAELRSIRHKQEAFMPAPDALWRELSPMLDDAMAGLGAMLAIEKGK
ncbi:MAG TPA: hypothetical protein VMF08_01150 [Candidatus Sulfotelmatobacter sp.]|nr:hypothetical protein [Candidatus Sulfotelmatobacter sp.]